MTKEIYTNFVAAIIRQAITDLKFKGDNPESKKFKESARSFLEASEELGSYCTLIGLDSKYIIKNIAKLKKS